MLEFHRRETDQKPFQITVQITFSQKVTLIADTSEHAWNILTQNIPMSMFRGRFIGITGTNGKLFVPGSTLKPGHYEAVLATYLMDAENLNSLVISAVEQLLQLDLKTNTIWRNLIMIYCYFLLIPHCTKKEIPSQKRKRLLLLLY